MALSFALQPGFWMLLLLAAAGLWLVARLTRLHWLPALGARLLLAALALAVIFSAAAQPPAQERPLRQVLVVDASDSLAPEARQALQAQAQSWQAQRENRAVVVFGAEAQAVLSGRAWPQVDARASDLATALETAESLLGPEPGEIILASDGQASNPQSAAQQANRLAALGHRLNVIAAPPRPSEADGFVGGLWAPSNLWAGTPFDVLLPVFAPQGGQVSAVRLRINGQDAPTEAEAVQPAATNQPGLYLFRVPAQPQGITTLEAVAEFSGGQGADPFPANNAAYATLQVFAAPRVLLLTASPITPAAEHLVQTLRSNRLEVDVQDPAAFPSAVERLAAYRVIFVHNLLSSQLNSEQMLALQAFTTRQAGGIVFLGGRNSYTLGGYKDTLLEPLLPVKLEPPPRSERPPVAFVLVMDRSSSMGISSTPTASGLQPIQLAREAAMRAIETMREQDYLGVLSFASEHEWTVPIGPLGSGLSLRQALDAVSQVEAFGSTNMYASSQEALAALKSLPPGAPAARHLLLLSDGKSYDGSLEEFRTIAAEAQASGITISTIAFGEGADAETMQAIAEAGKGRYYQVMQAEDLPRILIYESQAARSENVQSGLTGVQPGEPDHPLLSGLSPAQLPTLSGYNALSSKAEDGAEDILVSASFSDPLLSAWQVGLGRVLAWTGDLGEEWLGSWSDPQTEAQFWSQVVRYALVNPGLGPAQVNVSAEETQLVVEAFLSAENGAPLNLSQVRFTYADPDGTLHAFNLPQVSAGAYRLELPRPPEGAYRGVVEYAGPDGNPVETAAPFAVNPPPEWIPLPPDQGAADLAAWARATGGRVASAQALLQPEAGETTVQERTPAPGWRWLAAGLVLLWPLEIALRRRFLPWAG